MENTPVKNEFDITANQERYSDISPALGKFRDRDSIPYWSPATQDLYPRNANASKNNSTADNNSNLLIHAKEFVPSQYMNSGNTINNDNNANKSNVDMGNGNQYYEGDDCDPVYARYREMELELQEDIDNNQQNSWYPTQLTYNNNVNRLQHPQPSSYNSIHYSTICDELRLHFYAQNIESMKQMSSGHIRYKEIPARYNNAFPIGLSDNESGDLNDNGKSFGYPSSTYKCKDRTTCTNVVLRRFDNMKTTPAIVSYAMSQWQPLVESTYIVPLRSIHYDKKNSNAIYFVYDYFPLAKSIKEYYIYSNTFINTITLNETSSEKIQHFPCTNISCIWNLFTQLVIGMREIHIDFGNAIRTVDINHIIVTNPIPTLIGETREIPFVKLKYNCVGILDVLEVESRKSLSEMQAEDIYKLAQVLITVGLRIPTPTISKTTLLEQHYPYFRLLYEHLENGSVLCDLIYDMLRGKIQNIEELAYHRTLLPHLYKEMSVLSTNNDVLYQSLSREYENGRIARLLMKLGFVNERPHGTGTGGTSEADGWSDTGDRYVLKLFRDYLFHQSYPSPDVVTDEDNGLKTTSIGSRISETDPNTNASSTGVPCIDIGHVVSTLNKLDISFNNLDDMDIEENESMKKKLVNATDLAGANEKILLTSRNNKDLLIVSYRDVAR